MEFFRNTNIDFLGKKWFFLGFSLIFSVAGVLSMLFWHKIPLGVDFRGGTLVYVKFTEAPKEDRIRAALDRAGLHNARLQRYDVMSRNEELIDLPQHSETATDVTRDRNLAIQALSGAAPQGKQDLNNIGASTVRDALIGRDPLHVAPAEYEKIARQIMEFRDKQREGLFRSVDEAQQSGVQPAIVDALKQDFYTSNFHVFNAEIVGPQVGQQLRRQAIL
ncbi:MAG: protein translocase subunit SecF, partial [Terriglobales bacterium]